MPLTEVQREAMLLIDRIRACGSEAVADLERLAAERGIEICWSHKYTAEHLAVAQEVWKLWHTTNNFKVGDKVYVVPLTHTTIPTCIRAVVTEVNDDGWGYRLRAFLKDLPGIYMFNMWDKDLKPRVGRANLPTPAHLLLEKGVPTSD